jgi:hypothetical protein
LTRSAIATNALQQAAHTERPPRGGLSEIR